MATTPGQSLLLQILGDSASAVAATLQAGTALDGLTGKFPGLASATDSAGEAGQAFGDQLTNAFEHPLDAIQRLASEVSSLASDALGALGEAGEGAASVLAVVAGAMVAAEAATFALADDAAEAGEAVLGFSRQTGIAVENVGPLAFAAEAAGGSLQSLTTILRMVDMKEATDQSGKFSAALADIGINVDAFKKLDAEQQLLALAQGFQSGAKSGNTFADAMAIGGRGLANQLPLLEKLNPALLQTGRLLGVTWTPEQTQQAETFSLGLGTIETAFEGIGVKIGQALLPSLSEALEKFAESPQFINLITSSVAFFASALSGLLEIAGPVTAGMAKLAGAVADVGQVYAATMVYTSVNAKDQAIRTAAVQEFGAVAAGAKPFADGFYNTTKAAAQALMDLAAHANQVGPAIIAGINKPVGDGSGAIDKFTQAIEKALEALEGDTKQLQAQSVAIDVLISKQDLDIDTKERVAEAITKLAAAHVPLTEAQRQFLEGVLALQQAYPPLTEAQQQAVRDGTDLGETQAQLAAVLGVDVEQIKKYIQSLKDQQSEEQKAQKVAADNIKSEQDRIDKAMKAQADAWVAGSTAIKAIQKDLADYTVQTTGDTYEAQVKTITDWSQQQLDAWTKAQGPPETWSAFTKAQFLKFQAGLKQDVTDKIDALGPHWASSMADIEKAWAPVLDALGTGGKAIDTSLKTVIADATALPKELTQVKTAFSKGDVDGMVSGLGSLAGSLVSTAQSALQLDSALGGGVVGGAVAGAEFGAGLGSMFGPLGTAIGGLVGTIGGAIAGLLGLGTAGRDAVVSFATAQGGFDSLHEKLDAAGDAGEQMWKDLSNVGQDDAAQAQTEIATVSGYLDQLSGKAPMTAATVGDLLKGIAGGGASAQDAITALDTAFSTLSKDGTDGVGLWSDALKTFTAQVQDSGEQVDSVTAAIQGQVTNAQTGLNAALKVTSDAMAAAATDQQTIATGSADAAATATADLQTQQGIIDATSIKSQAAAQAVGASILATVAAQTAGGTAFVDAIRAAQPAIQGLQAQLTAAGYDGGAAFGQLEKDADVASDAIAGPALTAVEGYTKSVVSLSNAGLLSKQSFTALESQIGSTYTSLVAQGEDGSAVMDDMQGDLQTAWEMENKYGDTLDATTQSLVNQAVASGEVGAGQESDSEKMVDALQDVDKELGDLVKQFAGLGGAAQTAAGQVQAAFSGIQGPTVTVTGQMVPGAEVSASTTVDTLSASGVPIADIPLSSVTSPGLVWVRPEAHDVVGSLQGADLSALAPSSASQFGMTDSAFAGNVYNLNFNINAQDADSVQRWLQNGGGMQILTWLDRSGEGRTTLKRISARG